MSPPRNPPTCRRPGCPEPAVGPHGFCVADDLRYVQWRTWRDQLEEQDLASTGLQGGDQPNPATAEALDTLYRYLTPGPFTGERL